MFLCLFLCFKLSVVKQNDHFKMREQETSLGLNQMHRLKSATVKLCFSDHRISCVFCPCSAGNQAVNAADVGGRHRVSSLQLRGDFFCV